MEAQTPRMIVTPTEVPSSIPRSKKKDNTVARQHTRRIPVTIVGRAGGKAPRVVLNEGKEFEVIGGVGLKILEKLSRKANSWGGWRSGMDGPSLPIFNAVTAYVFPTTGEVIELGLGAAAFDDRVKQIEALAITHSMRKNNVRQAHNVALKRILRYWPLLTDSPSYGRNLPLLPPGY